MPNIVHPRPRNGPLGCLDDYPGRSLSGIDSLPLISEVEIASTYGLLCLNMARVPVLVSRAQIPTKARPPGTLISMANFIRDGVRRCTPAHCSSCLAAARAHERLSSCADALLRRPCVTGPADCCPLPVLGGGVRHRQGAGFFGDRRPEGGPAGGRRRPLHLGAPQRRPLPPSNGGRDG